MLHLTIHQEKFVAKNLPRTDEGVVEYITCDERTGRLGLCVGSNVEVWTEIQPCKFYLFHHPAVLHYA